MMYDSSRPVRRWLDSMPRPQDPPARPAVSPFVAAVLCLAGIYAALFCTFRLFEFIDRMCVR